MATSSKQKSPVDINDVINGKVSIMAPVDVTKAMFELSSDDWEALPVTCKAALQEAAGVFTHKCITRLYVIIYNEMGPTLVWAAETQQAIDLFKHYCVTIGVLDYMDDFEEDLVSAFLVPHNIAKNNNISVVSLSRIP